MSFFFSLKQRKDGTEWTRPCEAARNGSGRHRRWVAFTLLNCVGIYIGHYKLVCVKWQKHQMVSQHLTSKNNFVFINCLSTSSILFKYSVPYGTKYFRRVMRMMENRLKRSGDRIEDTGFKPCSYRLLNYHKESKNTG